MSVKIIQERFNSYNCQSMVEEEQALREISQEIVLAGLSRSDFFKVAAFQGGTCIRMFYGLNRFSEDMDFMLQRNDKSFNLESYIRNIVIELKAYGYDFEIVDRSKADDIVKTTFIKDNSIGKILRLNYKRSEKFMRKINIKIEIDSDPPQGSGFETKFSDFPFIFSSVLQDMPSLFAGKIHALLCREYIKGRDWYDLLWYLSKKPPINYAFLSSALYQSGPWKGKKQHIDKEWFLSALKEKILSIDWNVAKKDVHNFVPIREVPSIDLWDKELFIDRLSTYISNL
ncbi:MAG: nucleotidyl transferase AbiEii/AbiGii toxin family protein [Candidatus Omnitrophota bacterium]